ALLADDRLDQGRAPRQGASRQAVLSARPARQVGAHRRAHRAVRSRVRARKRAGLRGCGVSDRPVDPAAPPPWDEDFAAQLIGKPLLIGVTYADAGGSPLEKVQFHGIVVEADPARGITISCQGDNIGRKFNLPPDLRSISPAKPGDYRLRSTGEVLVDPDYTTSWTMRSPAS